MTGDVFQHVACGFVLREDVDVEGSLGEWHRFTTISVRGPRGDGRMHCTIPPLVGDTVFLSANEKELTGSYKVVDRQWMHASWGSMVWPIGEPIRSEGGVSLDLLVVRAGPGWYITEAPSEDEDES